MTDISHTPMDYGAIAEAIKHLMQHDKVVIYHVVIEPETMHSLEDIDASIKDDEGASRSLIDFGFKNMAAAEYLGKDVRDVTTEDVQSMPEFYWEDIYKPNHAAQMEAAFDKLMGSILGDDQTRLETMSLYFINPRVAQEMHDVLKQTDADAVPQDVFNPSTGKIRDKFIAKARLYRDTVTKILGSNKENSSVVIEVLNPDFVETILPLIKGSAYAYVQSATFTADLATESRMSVFLSSAAREHDKGASNEPHL